VNAAAIEPKPAPPHHPYRGYFYIAMAAVFWGISATLGRAAFTGRLLPASDIRRVDPLILSQARTTFSFIAVLLFLLPTRGWSRLRLPLADVGRLFMLGLAGVAASNYFYYLAIQRTNVATAIIVQYTAPVWVLVYMAARGIEKPTPSKITAVLLAITGIALVIGLFGGISGNARPHLDLIGVGAALLAAFSFTYYNIGGHSVLSRYDHWTVLLYVTMSASAFWIVVNPPTKIAAAHYSPTTWLFLAVFSIVSVLIPFSFYFAGLQHLEPTKAIIASCLEPVFSILIAAVVLREAVNLLQAVGVAMVLGAIIVVQRPARGQPVPPVAGPVD
jgi:drug/metabolite transporter (DMT)-like permease